MLIRIPENVDLSWSTFKDALIEIPGKSELYKTKISVQNNNKDLIILLDGIPKTEREYFSIGSLAFTEIGLLSEEFNLKLSIDNGKSFCAIDNKKQIISESNSVIVMEKIIKEKWYPYKKGNTIDFIISQEAPFIWDVENFKNMHTDRELKELRDSINKHMKIYLKELSIYDYDLEYLHAYTIDYIDFQLPPHADFYGRFGHDNINVLTVTYYPKADKGSGDLVLYNPFLFDYENDKPFGGSNFFGMSIIFFIKHIIIHARQPIRGTISNENCINLLNTSITLKFRN